jgi:single-strand DNA-binding protein
MASFNKVTVVGYLGRDPEIRFTNDGNPVCGFSVASTERQRDKEYTTWFRVAVWGRQAEVCYERLHRGDQVYVEGRLRHETYTKRGGENACSLTLQANNVEFIQVRARDEAEAQRAERGEESDPTRHSPRGGRREPEQEELPIGDDDIPF